MAVGPPLLMAVTVSLPDRHQVNFYIVEQKGNGARWRARSTARSAFARSRVRRQEEG